jgi:hypothetical protein
VRWWCRGEGVGCDCEGEGEGEVGERFVWGEGVSCWLWLLVLCLSLLCWVREDGRGGFVPGLPREM